MQVRVQYTDGREHIILLDAHRTLRFGTRRSADVQLEGGGIFPIHFGVLLHHGAFTVVASEQARKIRVNGKRVHESALHVGDRIEVGEIVVIVEDDLPTPATVVDTSTEPTGRESKSGSRSVWLARLALGCAVLPLVTLLGVYVGQLPTADELRQKADDAYREEDYARAVDCYDTYLRARPRSTESRNARTKRELADWLSREGESDAAPLVTDIQAASTEWSSDDNVSVSGALAQLLPPAVRDLTQQAQVAESSGSGDAADGVLALAQTGIDLMRRHLTAGQLRTADVDQLQADVLRLERPRDARTALENTLKSLEEAATKADWNAARSQREALLSAYPQWNRDGRLREALQQVAVTLANQVQILDPPNQNGSLQPTSAAWQARVQLVGTQPRPIAEAVQLRDASIGAARCIVRPGAGIVLGVDPITGRLLTRTSIGWAGPTTVCELGETDCLLADAMRQEVRRMDLASGAVKWRLPMQADAISTTSDGTLGIALTRPDVVTLVSLVDGEVLWQCRLPQAIDVAPVLDPERVVCYVVADESQVYTLSIDSGACLSVCAPGHGLGTVWAKPMSVGEYLLFVEQLGAELSAIHILRRGDALQVVQVVEISGSLNGLPWQVGSVVYLPVERGLVGRLRFNPDDRRKPFTVLDHWDVSAAIGRSPSALQWTFVGERICVGGHGISLFRAQADASLPEQVVELEPDFVAWGPLSLRGDCLLAVGSPVDSVVRQVRAWDLARPCALWSISLGAPIKDRVSATVEADELHIGCGDDSYVVSPQQFAPAVGQLTCVEPTGKVELTGAEPKPPVDPAAGPLNTNVREEIAGRSFEIAPEGLVCYGPDRALRWQTALSTERIVGLCLSGDGELTVGDAAGHVWRIGVDRGEIRQKMADVGEPLVAGPWSIAAHLVVLSQDGCLLVWE